jgi:cell fate (sporulation/competence/biofilm development) regulator YlbF (YheA/YmcA/DUF963 family)
VLTWFVPHDIGSTAAIADFFISIIGFAITIYGVNKAKSAAEAAKRAARETQERVQKFDTIVDFSAAIAILEEIKRLHREQAWQTLLERYSAMRKLLVQIRHSGIALTDEQNTVVQRSLTHLITLEDQVERAIATDVKLKVSKSNLLISEDVDGLVTVLTQLKNQPVGALP